MNDDRRVDTYAPSNARSQRTRQERPRRPKILRLTLMLGMLVGLSVGCTGEIGSVMGLDDPAVEIAGIRVEPSSVTLEVGDSEVLSAVSSDEMGEERTEEVTWTSKNPEIADVTQDGEVRAKAHGEAVILAANDDGEDDSATIEVVGEDEGGDEGGSGSNPSAGSGSHEPAGFETISDRAFDQPREGDWTSSGGIDMQIVDDESAPRSPSSVGQIRYPAEFDGGRTPTFTTLSGIESKGYRKLYVSFWLKLSENWQGHETGVNKIGFIWMHDKPVVFPVNWTGDGETMSPGVNLQDTPTGSWNLSANKSDLKIRKGEWHHWEIVLVANSGSSRDGEVHWWIDGEKVGEHSDIIFGDADQNKEWQVVAWRPTWGGRGDVVQEEMHMWMDHMYVSGAR